MKIKFGLFFSVLFFCTIVIANTGEKAIDIKFLHKEKTISAILEIQKNMSMEKDPKQLSAHPTAICFQANIDHYLIRKSVNDKKIYGCIFSDQVAMNSSLLRAGLFVHTDSGMASDAKLFNSPLMTAVGGHDFDGVELLKYHQQAVIPKECAKEHVQFKAIEKEFTQTVIDPIIKHNKDNFIFFAIINTKKFKQNLSHELLHAQYYNDPLIAQILQYVWEEKVKPEDKELITNSLRDGGYDMNQQELLLREFYSYFMQYKATEYLKGIKVLAPMSDLANVYAPIIKAALAKKHIRVLTVE